MSFINSLSTSGGKDGKRGERGERGERGIAGERGNTGDTGSAGTDAVDGATGEAGEDGATGPQGDNGPQGGTGPQGDTGPQGTNAGPDPTFDSVDVGSFNCGNSLKNNGYTTLRSNGIQLINFDRDIPEIGRKFTGIVILSALGNDLSSGVFAVSNNSNSVVGHIKVLSIQGDYSDSNKRFGLKYVNGTLMATKYNTDKYQRYVVSFFGYH